MRRAIAAGSYYDADVNELKDSIHELFLGNLGPGKLADIKKEREEKQLYGIIAPHAGYIYSGQAAAHAYKAVAESKKFDTFIVLGTDHTGYADSDFSFSLEDFETPLGSVRIDKELAKLIIRNSKKAGINADATGKDEKAHSIEHSIEVQLPFLQSCVSEFKIVPIMVSRYDAARCGKFAAVVVDTAENLKRKICVIASGDFTHYGNMYGFVPFTSHIKENIYGIDKKAISRILKFDTSGFLGEAGKTTICGAGVISTCIEICKRLGSKKAELLKYYTLGDITLHYDTDAVIGYAAIAFR